MSSNLFLGKSCSGIKYYSPQATSGAYVIDPDDEGSHKPFTVFCDMTDKNGVGVTVISHDSEARMHVKGYEPRGSYVRNVHYIATGLTNMPQLAYLTDVSTYQVRVPRFPYFSRRHCVVGVTNCSQNDLLGRGHTS